MTPTTDKPFAIPTPTEIELPGDLLGVNALDPFFRNSSSARKTMMATQIGQAPIVMDNEPRRIFTGFEMEYSKYTFDIRFPKDCRVLKIIKKFPIGITRDTIRHNPVTTIIYEEDEYPKRVGVLHVPEYASYHQDFGFRYKYTEVYRNGLYEGGVYAAGTVLAASSAVRENGQYGIGLEAEVAFMSMPGTIEDGFVVSESFMRRMTPTTYHTVVGNWGRKAFPLNLYGDENSYRPFPDIGETIRDDGIVMALRDADLEQEASQRLGVAEMTPRALRTVDGFDKPLYGKAGAKVVDVKVYYDDRQHPVRTPIGMDTQARKYYDAERDYYQKLMEEYYRLRSRREATRRGGIGLQITPEFNRLLVEAQIYLPQTKTDPKTNKLVRKLTRMHRLETLDEFRVEITYEHQMHPGEGFKFTDMHGGKGVDCKTVLKDEDMPTDENGNRTDVVIYGGGSIKRMNMGRFYEHYLNACSRDLTHRIRKAFGMDPHTPPITMQLIQAKNNAEMVNWAWNKLLDYYQIVAPRQYALLCHDAEPERHARYVMEVLRAGIYLWIPPDNPVDNLEMAKCLMASEFAAHYGKVTYRDNAGRLVTTNQNVLIGSMYMILLEKTGDDWSGAASVKTQHFGVPAKLNASDKQTTPGRQAPVRGLGESETRSFVTYVGPEPTMELLDQSNNPQTHRAVVEAILNAPQPTNIDKVVDRQQIPFGGSRPVCLANHINMCRGIEFVYKPDAV